MAHRYVLDPNVLAAIQNAAEVLDVVMINESAWAKAMLVEVRHADETEERYFMKVRSSASSISDDETQPLSGIDLARLPR